MLSGWAAGGCLMPLPLVTIITAHSRESYPEQRPGVVDQVWRGGGGARIIGIVWPEFIRRTMGGGSSPQSGCGPTQWKQTMKLISHNYLSINGIFMRATSILHPPSPGKLGRFSNSRAGCLIEMKKRIVWPILQSFGQTCFQAVYLSPQLESFILSEEMKQNNWTSYCFTLRWNWERFRSPLNLAS